MPRKKDVALPALSYRNPTNKLGAGDIAARQPYFSPEPSNSVPSAQPATDLANHDLPNYSSIVPNKAGNAHDCLGGRTDYREHQKLWLLLTSGSKTTTNPFLQRGDFSTLR